MFRPFAVAMVIALAPAASLAGPCGDAAGQLARAHDLRADPDAGETGSRGGTSLSDRLAETGGVLVPPDEPAANSESVIEPPDPERFPMPTAPDVQARPPSPPDEAPAPDGAPEVQEGADRLRAESLLMAARTADEEGDEDTCRERLAEARDILDDTGVAEE